MTRFVVLSLGFLGWGFYELSGGADFVPEVAAVAEISAPSQVEEQVEIEESVAQTPVVEEPTAESVSRADSEMLLSVAASFEPETVDEPEIVEVIVSPPVVPDRRTVAAARVNMRSGPSTDYAVLATLPRGTKAEVLEVNLDGWARVLIFQTGEEGWIAERLLSDS